MAEGNKNKLNLFETGFIIICILLFITAASLVSLNRYWQFNAFWYDFVIFDTTVWKLSRFQLPIIAQLHPPMGKIVWADHFNPSAVFLAPLYWLINKQEIILVAQSVSVGLSALVAYIISKKKIADNIVRISLVTSYLGFVGLQNALYTDVHNIVFALLPLMFTIWAAVSKKWKLYWIFLGISLGFQESMAAVVTMFGLYLLLNRNRNIKAGIFTVIIGILYGIITIKVMIPYFNEGRYIYQPLFPLTWQEWITRLIYPFDIKLRTIILTYASFGFLPIGSLATLPMIFEHFLERFVLNSAATRWDLGFHYNALLSPIMFLASFDVITRIQNRKTMKKILRYWALGTIFIVLFFHRFYLHGPLMLSVNPIFYEQTKNNKFIDDFAKQIPKKGLLMTQNNLAAHFTHGETILLNKNYQQIKPDVVALDIRPGQNANNYFPLSENETNILVSKISTDTAYLKKQINSSQIFFIKK